MFYTQRRNVKPFPQQFNILTILSSSDISSQVIIEVLSYGNSRQRKTTLYSAHEPHNFLKGQTLARHGQASFIALNDYMDYLEYRDVKSMSVFLRLSTKDMFWVPRANYGR